MGQVIYQVDSFTTTRYAGNPAGVCLLPAATEASWMQAVAREMNLAETAFAVANGEDFDLRWFTPAVEIDLCGHATLATAHILWETGALAPDRPARFHTLSGLLTTVRAGEWIEMDFPALPGKVVESPPPALARALGVEPLAVTLNASDMYLVEVASEDIVRDVTPDFPAIAAITTHGVILTSHATTSGYDFVSRYFAPAIGINEDPVTGSAHCALAPYWAERLGRDTLTGYQASSRGGTVSVRAEGDRVILSGQAITVLRGELTEDAP